MTLASAIAEAKNFLVRSQRPDGGIPAVAETDPSGFWTTAETLDAFVQCPVLGVADYPFLERSCAFLLGGQLATGAWPLGPAGSTTGSVMATGHCLAALARLRRATPTFDFGADIEASLATAADWLRQNQLPDGLWGVEPEVPEGNVGKILSTYYAVYGLSISGERLDASIGLRRAANALEGLQTGDGGWPHSAGDAPSVSATAMAVQLLILLAQGRYRERVERGLQFIRQNSGDLSVQNVSYVVPGGPGQVHFHYNTMSEAGAALLVGGAKCSDTLLASIVDRLIATQASSGSWALQDLANCQDDIIMWPTAEYFRLLSLVAVQRLSENLPAALPARPPYRINIVLAAALVLVSLYALAATKSVQGSIAVALPWLKAQWASLPPVARWVLGLGAAGIGALVSTLFVDAAKARLLQIVKRIRGDSDG